MKPKIAVGPSSFAATDKTPLKMLEDAGYEVIDNPFKRRLTESEIIDHLEGMVGLIAGLEPLNRTVLTSAKSLKALARVGIGVANVDFDAAADLDIKVSSTPDGPTDAVAEICLGNLISLLRRVPETNAALHKGEWKKVIGRSIRGCKVLFVGYGRIGRKFSALLKPLGVEVYVNDPYISKESLTDGEVLIDLHDGLALCDAVTLHVSGEDTVIGSEEFSVMKEGMVILNSARGGLIEEEALYPALDSGKVSGIWIDALWQEPYNGKLMEYDNAILTPHIGTYSRECRLSMESKAVENLLRDLQS